MPLRQAQANLADFASSRAAFIDVAIDDARVQVTYVAPAPDEKVLFRAQLHRQVEDFPRERPAVHLAPCLSCDPLRGSVDYVGDLRSDERPWPRGLLSTWSPHRGCTVRF